MHKQYTEEDFKKAVKESFSIRQVLIKIGLKLAGGNFSLAKKRIEDLNLDSSHFTGKGYLKGKTHSWSRLIPLDKVLVKNSTYSRKLLKGRLIKNGILENKCSICGQEPKWNGKPLVMVIDHINGINNDHRLENLRIVCRHCDSQLSTFCGRNVKNKNVQRFCLECNAEITRQSKTGHCVKCANKRSGKLRGKKHFCSQCGNKRSGKSQSGLCSKCSKSNKRKVINRPSKEILVSEVKELGYRGAGRKYGVSDNAVRKWIK